MLFQYSSTLWEMECMSKRNQREKSEVSDGSMHSSVGATTKRSMQSPNRQIVKQSLANSTKNNSVVCRAEGSTRWPKRTFLFPFLLQCDEKRRCNITPLCGCALRGAQVKGCASRPFPLYAAVSLGVAKQEQQALPFGASRRALNSVVCSLETGVYKTKRRSSSILFTKKDKLRERATL